VAPILPGWKSGRLPARVTSMEEYARLLLDFIDSEKIETVDVVGTSVGGWIAIHMALTAPERVSRLVLSNAMGLDLPDLPATNISGLSEDDLSAAAFAAKSGMMVATGDFGGVPRNLRESEMFRHIVHGQHNLEALSGGRCGEAGLADRLGSLSPKTLLLWGDQDEIVPLAHGERMQTLIAGSRLVAIEAAGHCPYKEKPNTFVRLVSDFLLDQEEAVAGSRKIA
jgi:pimeloyl-ACP methyl ester carboxylesterase